MKKRKKDTETHEQSEKGILLNVADRIYIRRFPKTDEEPPSIKRAYSRAFRNLDRLVEDDSNNNRQPT